MDLTETSKDKPHFGKASKADPTTAMKERQPAQVAFDENTLESLNSIQHKDIHGNLITDPDKSNPTRPRLERPLDTIRSFEAAINGSYNKRLSARPVSQDNQAPFQSRRSSYYQGYNNTSAQARYPGDGGFHNSGTSRMGPLRPDSYSDNYSNRHSPAPFRNDRRAVPRNQSESTLYNSNHVQQQSYETATTASNSGNSYGTEPYAHSTDPSSENSSVDRIPQQVKPDLGEAYGFNGFGGAPEFQGPILEEHGQGTPTYGQPGYGQQVATQPGHGLNAYSSQAPNGRAAGHPGGYARQANDMPPPPPPHQQTAPAPRVPIKLSSSNMTPSTDSSVQQPVDNGEKRKSWLKRRFSKKS